MDYDIKAYLEDKGCEVTDRASAHISTQCFFCGEDPGKRGRLYINVDEGSDKYGVFFCHLCGEKGGLNKIRYHFGDPKIEISHEYQFTYDPIMVAATDYYVESLDLHPEAYEYLTETRGLTEKTIQKAKLGWADGKLSTHLINQGFSPDEIKETGLVNKHGSDFFKDAIIFPYLDHGYPVQLRGKQIGGKTIGTAKPLEIPYGIDTTIGEDTILTAEGEFDTLTLHQLGYPAIGVPGVMTFKNGWEDYFEDAKRIYIMFDNDKAGKAGAEKMSNKLGSRTRVVEIPYKGADVNDLLVKKGKNRDDFDYLLHKAKGGLLVSMSEAYDRWLEIEGNKDLDGLRFNVPGLDKVMNIGLLPGQVAVLIAKTGSGKPHPHGTIIQTPSGPIKFGDLKIGDEVWGSNGKPTKVIGVHEQGLVETYRVTFSDGTSVLTGPDHLWEVYSRYGKRRTWCKKDVLSTLEIKKSGLRAGNNNRELKYRIPLIEPVEYSEKQLLIPPYTMGALIANGDTRASTPSVRTPDVQVYERCLTEGIKSSGMVTYAKDECPQFRVLDTAKHIRAYGLDVKSGQEFIPEDYLMSSVKQRLFLLRGLMDGDGSNPAKYPDHHHKSSLSYSTTSEQLSKDMVVLVNSLGGTATVCATHREDVTYDVLYSLSIMLPNKIREGLFTERKEFESSPTTVHVPHRAITSIEKEGIDNQRCITVEADDSLYSITENYILTHNSVMSMNLFQRMRIMNPDIKILYASLELTRNQVFEAMFRIHQFYFPEASAADFIHYWQNNLLLIDQNRISENDLAESIDQFAYESGFVPDLICVDYLGYYARGVSGSSEYDQTTNAIMGLKSVAKDTQSVILTPHQVNRTGNFATELQADQAKSSGAVENTADWMASQWSMDTQPGITPEEATGEVFQKILKSRNGGANTKVTYIFDPLSLAVVPIDDHEMASRAYFMRDCWKAGDTWEEAIKRLKTGDLHI